MNSSRMERLPSPAKLNLFLHVCGRRSDGYHELQTAFQFIDFCDYLTFDANSTGEVRITGMSVPLADNLIYRAATRLQAESPVPVGVDIHVEKHIPMGAGLAGGSTNAATTLLALNRLWSLHLPKEQLLAMGATLGADVPIFIHGKSAFAEGIGEKLTTADFREKTYLLIVPECHIATAEIFSHEALTRDTKKKRIAAFPDEPQAFVNDCEPLVRKLYPEVDKAFKQLQAFGPTRMTGTGSCLFLSFDDDSQAQQIAVKLPADLNAYKVRGMNTSATLTALALMK